MANRKFSLILLSHDLSKKVEFTFSRAKAKALIAGLVASFLLFNGVTGFLATRVVSDAYNANPTSMAAAITHFSLRDQPNKVLILGDMLELGTGTEVEHRSILDLVNRYQWERVFLIGPVFCRLQPGPDRFESVEKMQQIDWESALPRASNILIKGSRGIRLELLLTD